MLCPCGSSLSFDRCCQPYILASGAAKLSPRTPEQLMRSRFSAYAVKNAQYIFDTYGQAQRLHQSVSDIQSWANECTWVALVIHSTDIDCGNKMSNKTLLADSQAEKLTGVVEFSAYYIIDNTLCELREKSNFTVEHGFWRYIDGEITVNNKLANVKRNELCPCNQFLTAWSAKQGKKFKHCCARS